MRRHARTQQWSRTVMVAGEAEEAAMDTGDSMDTDSVEDKAGGGAMEADSEEDAESGPDLLCDVR